jgi:hypothetical protein
MKSEDHQYEAADEIYRDKLVEWMITHDIPTGGDAQTFDDLLEVIGTTVTELKKQRQRNSHAAQARRFAENRK